jgi:hypothetical protein
MYRTSYRSIPTSRGRSYLPTSRGRSYLPTSRGRSYLPTSRGRSYLPTSNQRSILPAGASSSSSLPRGAYSLGTMKRRYLRNCTKLRKSLLGNGELASLAYGSFKELHKFAELFQIEGIAADLGEIRGPFGGEPWSIWGENRGRFGTDLGQNLVAFWAPFLPLFWAVGVRGFACIWTFPGFEAPFLACFRRVFERTFGRCFERSGAPSEYGHVRQIACDG